MTAGKLQSKGLCKNLTAGNFSDSQFMSAAGKLKVVRHWERFVVARVNLDVTQLTPSDYGCSFRPWTLPLYRHFSLHLGHIAHFDRHGFFAAQWLPWESLQRNMNNLAKGRDNMGFDMLADREYADVNKALVDVAREYLAPVLECVKSERKAQALAALADATREVREANSSE